jgi:hypothetical protein
VSVTSTVLTETTQIAHSEIVANLTPPRPGR